MDVTRGIGPGGSLWGDQSLTSSSICAGGACAFVVADAREDGCQG